MAKTTAEALKEKLTGSTAFNQGTGEITLDNPHDAEIGEPEYSGESDPVQLVSKLSVSTIGGDPGAAKLERGAARTPIAVMLGRAHEIKIVEDPATHKEFKALVGAFHAINLQTGMQYASGIMYLPDAFQALIIATLEVQEDNRSSNAAAYRGVEFSYQIDAIPAKNPAGYSYVLRNNLPAMPSNDPLRGLKARTSVVLEAKGHRVDLLAPPPVVNAPV